MMKGKTKIYKHTKGNTLYVAIPSNIATDSAFPFEIGEKISIEISFDTVILKKIIPNS